MRACVKLNCMIYLVILTKTDFFGVKKSLLLCKDLQIVNIQQLTKLLLVLILCVSSLLRVWAQLTGRRISARSK